HRRVGCRTKNRKIGVEWMPLRRYCYAAYGRIEDGPSIYKRPLPATLRQSRSGLALHQRGIDRIDEAIDVYVLPEVGICNRVAGLRFRLARVDRIAKPISVCVAEQDSHRQ